MMYPCFPRFSLALLLAVVSLIGFGNQARATDAAVIISEIQYHPGAGDTEWVELHSLSGVDIDMSGWRLKNAVDFTFPSTAKITGHGYLIVALNPSATSLSGLGALGPWSGSLNNSGEKITLVNRDGREMDTVDYKDGGDWPAAADGSGGTLARRNSESADPAPTSWISSPSVGGTPGRVNFAPAGQLPTVTTPILLDATWKSFVGTPPANWQQPGLDDSTWTAGQSLFYSGSPTLAGGGDGLLGYWPLDQISGTTTPNLAPGGAAATLVNGPTIVNDTRGLVMQFNGTNQYANAGSIPPITLAKDFTWSFWASSAQGVNNNIMLGNRYSTTPGVDWNPREFIKFTTSQFEFHHDAIGDGIVYAGIAAGSPWMHHAVVKSGSSLTYYRNGVVGGTHTIAGGLVNPQPLYFGGEQTDEYWGGKMDDVAIWGRALTGAQITALSNGSASPLTVTSGGSLRTQLAPSPVYAFRKSFDFPGTPSRTTLTMKVLVEDGCTVWLNGTQVYTQNNPPTSGVDTAAISADIPIPNTALVKGANVVAVEVPTFAGDPDMVFGAQLTISEAAPTPEDASPKLVFNEISAGGADFQVELANISGGAIDLTGYTIRSSSGGSFALSGTLNAGGLLALTAAQLGFTPVSGDKLFLYMPDGVGVADGREVTNRLRGRSIEQAGRWLYPTVATFGAANAFTFTTDVVINEIMYSQRPLTQSPFVEDPEQWVELYNRGAAAVALDGWKFAEGIDYTFPPGTSIPPGGYLVVSNNAAALQAKWPAVASKIIGDFTGTIRRGGERLLLADASGNPANEVTFANDSPWPTAASGEGSSLELRDPRADNSRPEAWAPSDEAARGSWQTYTFEAVAAPSVNGDPTRWNEFIFGLHERGSMMIDDISVIESPTGANRELIQNGSFDAGTAAWRFLGTHSRAAAIADPFGTGQVLRVDATDASEHMHNHCETTLKSGTTFVTISSALTYRISFRARWISGCNLLNTRMYFNRIAKTTVLPVAPGGGTPGSSNTAAIPNLGPTFTGLTHSPAVPPANQPATVSVNVADPDGLGAVSLFYSVSGGAFTSVAMVNQGSGLFTGTIPGQAAAAKVQYYVQAADGLGAIGFAPPLGPTSRAMIPWDDGQARLTLNNVHPNNIRIVMTPADVTKLHTLTNVMSNDRLPCTVIWNERDIYYDCGIHLHGSERGRDQPVRVSFNVRFPGDHPLLGVQDSVVIDRSGAGNEFSQKEILIKRAITRAGAIPGSEDDLCRVIAPQTAQTGPAIFARQRVVSGEYLDSAYPGGGNGDLFKYELIYYPTTTSGGTPEGLKLPEPDSVAGVNVTDNLGTNKEAYRWHWLISNLEQEDDYSRLMTWLTAFRQPAGAQYYTDTNNLMDVSEWLRSFAVEILFGIGDNYATGAQHNLYVYRRPSDAKWLMIPYDMDFTFNAGTTSSLFPNSDLSKLTQNPGNRRTYLSHIYELCQTSFSSTYLSPWATHYNAFLNENLTQWMSYIDARRTYALAQVNTAIPPVAFNITTPDGPAPGPTVTLNGTAWVDVKEMRLANSNQPLAVSWTSTSAWQAAVTIASGTNTITINAFNAAGVQIGTDTVVITGTGSVVLASASNLVISEIMYHPGPLSTAEQNAGFTDPEAFEFIELQNISPTDTIGLAGARFTAGVSLNLPNVNLAPGARAILVGNQAAFTQRYGVGATILGAYQPGNFLSNSGDHITLVDSLGQTIRDFSYDDAAPWPSSGDGGGYSIQLINPSANPVHGYALNWRSSAAANGNPGATDSTTFTGNPNADDNGDGYSNLVQYALAGATPLVPPVLSDDGSFLTITFRKNLAADDALVTVQRSVDLQNWTTLNDVTYVDEVHLSDGTAVYTWRSTHPLTENAHEFLRLEITKP